MNMFGLHKIHSKLLYKYMLSYLLMFFIPLVFMSVIIYQNSVVSLREGIEQSNIDKLNQVKNLTDDRMEELEKLAVRISYDHRLSPYMVNDGFYGKEAIEELNKYKANSSIIKELFLYYHGDTKIYSSNGSYSFKTFEQTYRFDQSEKKKISKALESNLPIVFPAESVTVKNNEKERLITYLHPTSRNTATPYGAVIYLIEESAITGSIKDILGDFQGNAYIFDENKNILTSNLNSIGKTDIKKLEKIDKSGVSSVNHKGNEYSVVSVKSEISGWTFVTVMPTDQFFSKVINLQKFLTLLLISIVLTGSGAAILLARNQYRPIHNLLDFITKNNHRVYDINNSNELETIQVTVAKVLKDHESLSEKMDIQAPFVRDQYLMRMLNGHLTDDNEINSLLDSLGIVMKSDQYFVVLVSFNKEFPQKREEIIRFLSFLTFNEATSYGVEVGYKDAIALIISIDQSVENSVGPRKIVPEIKCLLEKNFKFEPIISVGNLYYEKSKINRSFIEALAALENRFMNDRDSITYFEDISSRPERTIGYPKEEQIKFVQSLKQGDQIVAIETIKYMFESVANKELSVQMIKCLCFDIINTVLKVAVEIGLDDQTQDINRVVEFNSIGDLEKNLYPIIIDICNEVERRNENNNSKLCNEIISHINDNFSNYDLSLENIAQKFKLSTSYLSRFLKEQTGVTFTQYVWHLRIEEVKRLLAETDETIKNIVLKAGYIDVANFTRKFKKTEGVTPGQYRNLYASRNNQTQPNLENDKHFRG